MEGKEGEPIKCKLYEYWKHTTHIFCFPLLVLKGTCHR